MTDTTTTEELVNAAGYPMYRTATGTILDGGSDTDGRPFWLDGQTCPAWCGNIHRAEDGGGDDGDRRHTGGWDLRLPLLLPDPTSYATGKRKHGGPERLYEPVELLVYVEQGWRESEPRVCIADEPTNFQLDLTLAEARAVADALHHALDLAEGHCST